MTITLNGTTLTNSGFGTVLTNVGEGYLTNAATLTNEHRAYLINIGVGTTLTNEEASTLTNTGADSPQHWRRNAHQHRRRHGALQSGPAVAWREADQYRRGHSAHQ